MCRNSTEEPDGLMRCCGAQPTSNPITGIVRVQFISVSRMDISSNIRVSHESNAWEMDFFFLKWIKISSHLKP